MTHVAEHGLKYIADSPPREYGGFHPSAVAAARSALRLISRLKSAVKARERRVEHLLSVIKKLQRREDGR